METKDEERSGKDKALDWVKQHKVQIGVSAVVAVGAVAGIAVAAKTGHLPKLGCIRESFGKSAAAIAEEGACSAAQVAAEEAASNVIPAATEAVSQTAEVVEQTVMQVNVDGHLRRLPEGFKASQSAIENAKFAGMPLPEGRTYVRAYEKYCTHAA